MHDSDTEQSGGMGDEEVEAMLHLHSTVHNAKTLGGMLCSLGGGVLTGYLMPSGRPLIVAIPAILVILLGVLTAFGGPRLVLRAAREVPVDE
jgi:hypothetical protein